MSCNYADGLSPYEHKGILGANEKFDCPETVKTKCLKLAEYIREAKHIVVHTGAGISTSAGIPDFRGPNGVWTLEEKGLKPNINISFSEAKPTKTHMALKQLVDDDIVHYIVSQNIDGLHLKSGIKREVLAELHGNMFIDQCNFCKRQFVRSSPAPTVGQRTSGVQCHGGGTGRKPCRGKLHDTILDWEHSLPDDDLELSDKNACMADLSICLGTTLQINPSGNVPLNTLRYGGKMVICNLQPTKHDNKADLIINTYVDDVFVEVMKLLGKEIPEYKPEEDPVSISKDKYIEWTISKKQLTQTKSKFKKKCDGGVKRRVLVNKEYKIQQDELKTQSKKLPIEVLNKSLQEAKEPKTKKPKIVKEKKIPKSKVVKEVIVHESIELYTSDEDDLILVDDSKLPCIKVDTKEKQDKTETKLELKRESVDTKESLSEETPDPIKKEDLKIPKDEKNIKEDLEIEENIKSDIKEEIEATKLNEDLDMKIEEGVHSKEIETKIEENIKSDIKEEIEATKLNEDLDMKIEEGVHSKEIETKIEENIKSDIKEEIEATKLNEDLDMKIEEGAHSKENTKNDFTITVHDQNGADIGEELKPNINEQPNSETVKDINEKPKDKMDVEETVENAISDAAHEENDVRSNKDIEMRETSKEINSIDDSEVYNGKII